LRYSTSISLFRKNLKYYTVFCYFFQTCFLVEPIFPTCSPDFIGTAFGFNIAIELWPKWEKNSPTYQKLKVKLSEIGEIGGFSGFFSDFRGESLFLGQKWESVCQLAGLGRDR